MEKWKTDRIAKNKKRVYVFSSMNEKAQKITLSLAEHSDESTAVIFYETIEIDSELEEQLGSREVSHISHNIKLDVETNKLPLVDLKDC